MFVDCAEGMTVPPSSPESQVSLGEGTNSTVAGTQTNLAL